MKKILLYLIIMMVLTIGANAQFTSSLEYLFNENNATDTSGNANHGTVTGATWNSTGDVANGGAFDFDGKGDFIEFTSDIVFTNGTAISFWINPTVPIGYNGNGGRSPGILSEANSGSWNNLMSLKNDSENATLFFENSAGTVFSSDPFEYKFGYNYFAVSYLDNNSIDFYYNNQHIGQVVGSGSATFGGLGTGYAGSTNGGCLNGSLGNFQFWGEPLDETQVRYLYLSQQPNNWTQKYNDFMEDNYDWKCVLHWSVEAGMHTDTPKCFESLMDMYKATNNTLYLNKSDFYLLNLTARQSEWNESSSDYIIGHIGMMFAQGAYKFRFSGDEILVNRSETYEAYAHYVLSLIDDSYHEFVYNGETIGTLWDEYNKTTPLNQYYGYMEANAFLGMLNNATRLDRANKMMKALEYSTWNESCTYDASKSCRITPYRMQYNVSMENMTGGEWGLNPAHETTRYFAQTSENIRTMRELGITTNDTWMTEIANSYFYQGYAQEGGLYNVLLWEGREPPGEVSSVFHGYHNTHGHVSMPYYSAYVSNISNISEQIIKVMDDGAWDGTGYNNFYYPIYENITDPVSGNESSYLATNMSPSQFSKFVSAYVFSQSINISNVCSPKLVNTTWVNQTVCNASSIVRQNATEYDVNDCGVYSNTTIYQDTSCVYNRLPAIESARINPALPFTNDTLMMFCNATDPDGDNLTYFYQVFNNSVVFSSGNSTGHSQGIEVNLYNVSSSNLAAGESWVIECRAYDEVNYSNRTNSSAVNISEEPFIGNLGGSISFIELTECNYDYECDNGKVCVDNECIAQPIIEIPGSNSNQKTTCIILSYPSEIIIHENQSLVDISIRNDEENPVHFSLKVDGADGHDVAPGYFKLSDNTFTLEKGDEQEVSVEHIKPFGGHSDVETKMYLKITSEECNDVLVPIRINLSESKDYKVSPMRLLSALKEPIIPEISFITNFWLVVLWLMLFVTGFWHLYADLFKNKHIFKVLGLTLVVFVFSAVTSVISIFGIRTFL